ncbi:MAG: hypothetical protein ACTSRP_09720 [Candidatus Helarchaeota archaeon]
MSTISEKILVKKLKAYCTYLDPDKYILDYYYCKKRKYHINPNTFCKYCPYYK